MPKANKAPCTNDRTGDLQSFSNDEDMETLVIWDKLQLYNIATGISIPSNGSPLTASACVCVDPGEMETRTI